MPPNLGKPVTINDRAVVSATASAGPIQPPEAFLP
jgi:hypothetical protein